MKNKTNYLLVALLLMTTSFVGCKKDDDDNNSSPTPNPTPTLTVNSEPQVSGKIDGVAFNWKTGGADGYQQSVSHGGPLGVPPDSCEFVMGTGFENVISGAYLMDVNLGTYKFVMPTDSVLLKNFFTIKSWNYSIDAANGVEIVYFDSNGDMWSTSFGSANQTGSTYSLQDRRYFKFSGEHYIRVKASFSCKLYNAVGASKLLTDGVIVSDYWTEY